MIKLGTLSKLLTENYNTTTIHTNQSYLCEASFKASKASYEFIEELIKHGKLDDAAEMIRKIKLEKVGKLRKGWDKASSFMKKTWSGLKRAVTGTAAAAGTALVGTSLYAGYKLFDNIRNSANNPTNGRDYSIKKPVYVMTNRHGQIFDDNDVKIKTIEDQKKELMDKEKEHKPIDIDLNNVYDNNGNKMYQNNSGPSFSIGNFIDKTDNAFYNSGHTIGKSIGGGISYIENDASDISDTFTGDNAKEGEK